MADGQTLKSSKQKGGLAISLTIVFSVLKYGVANLQSLRCLFSTTAKFGKEIISDFFRVTV
jgi:hypothetical protein